jgi:hypothetical protein
MMWEDMACSTHTLAINLESGEQSAEALNTKQTNPAPSFVECSQEQGQRQAESLTNSSLSGDRLS